MKRIHRSPKQPCLPVLVKPTCAKLKSTKALVRCRASRSQSASNGILLMIVYRRLSWSRQGQPGWSPLTRLQKLHKSLIATISGCMSMQQWLVVPCCCPSTGTYGRASKTPIQYPGTHINGWAQFLTAHCFTSKTQNI